MSSLVTPDDPRFKQNWSRDDLDPDHFVSRASAFWPMTEGAGSKIADFTGTNTGTLSGGVSWVTGQRGLALKFDGSTGYVNIGTPASLSSLQVNMTISGWFNAITLGVRAIFSQYENVTNSQLIKLVRVDNSKLNYFCSTANGGYQTFTHTTTLSVNTWYFFWIVVSDSLSSPTLRMGVASPGLLAPTEQPFSPAALSNTPDTTVPVFIGSDYALKNSTLEVFNGLISDIRITQALSFPQVLSLYTDPYACFRSSRLTPGIFGASSPTGSLLLRRRRAAAMAA